MSPEERQLITGLFDRMRPAANQQRDRDAEQLIGEQVRTQPYAPYLLAQTVIVQDQALRAAHDKIQALEDQVRQHQSGAAQPEETSFLGGIGRSIFGTPQQDPGRSAVPAAGGRWGPPPQDQGYRGQGYAPQAPQAAGPWGQSAPAQGGGLFGGGGGGFMKGALGAAAGVAGGVLMADGIRNLFSGGHNPYGIASGIPGAEAASPAGETIINNYYDSPDPGRDALEGGNDQVADMGGDGFDPGSYGGYGTDV